MLVLAAFSWRSLARLALGSVCESSLAAIFSRAID
jgi:hypothetical protein